MTILRRLLGVFVMTAGILGLVLSLAGLAALAMARPTLTASLNATVDTLSTSVDVSRQTLAVTNQALGATVASVDALSDMLSTTATTVEETQPVIVQVTTLMSVTLPTTLDAVSASLTAAEEAARSLESAIRSFETFQAVLQATPLISAFVPASQQTYAPDKPLADSLAELNASLQDMPSTFVSISGSVDKADDNLSLIKDNLVTMSESASLISASLGQYQAMIGESQTSMGNLQSLLADLQSNLERILNVALVVAGLFLAWLLAAQVVIFSQGWELYRGTADRMEAGKQKPEAEAPGSVD